MVYFAKEELDEWLLQNYEPTVNGPCAWRRKPPPQNRSLIRDAMENERKTDRSADMGMDEHRLSDILLASQIKATDIYETRRKSSG